MTESVSSQVDTTDYTDQYNVDGVASTFPEKYCKTSEVAVSLQKNYILKLCTDKAYTRVVTGSTDASVHIFDLSAERGFTAINVDCISNKASQASTSGVEFLDDSSNLLLIGDTKGLIRLYDLRTNVEQTSFALPVENEPQQINCFDRNANGRIICTGNEENAKDMYLSFFDVRERKFIGSYTDAHTDSVTTLRFHETNPDLLCSGSVDGLINVFDISEAEEDDAILNTIYTESSVHKLRWHKNVYEKDIIGCITHTNDFMSYDAQNLDLLAKFNRLQIAQGIQYSNEDDINLIDSHNMVHTEDGTWLLVGTNSNEGEIMRSVKVKNSTTTQPLAAYSGNKQIVRESHYNNKLNTLITAGENGLLTLWALSEATESRENSKLKSKTKSLSKKSKPY